MAVQTRHVVVAPQDAPVATEHHPGGMVAHAVTHRPTTQAARDHSGLTRASPLAT
jgi:hypothetical protein